MSEHLLVFPDEDTAQAVAAELADEGFTQVQIVRESFAGRGPERPLSGAGDAGAAPDPVWGVHVREDNVVDESRPVARGLRERFEALVEERGGWYDPHPTPR